MKPLISTGGFRGKEQAMSRYRTYQFGGSTLTLRFGDLIKSEAQVLVSSDDCYISMGGGISAAILRAGGETIALDASKKVPAALGEIVVTSAGTLPAQYIFHAITIGPNPDGLTSGAVIERTTRRCMQLLDGLQLSSIAFPAIGAGVAGFSYDEVSACMAEVIADELPRRKKPIEVTIFLFDRFGKMVELDFLQFFEQFALRAPRIAVNRVAAQAEISTPEVSCGDFIAETEEEFRRRRLHSLRKLLAQLEDQRGQLEERLISLLGDANADGEGTVRKALTENQDLRLQYLAELGSFKTQDADVPVAGHTPKPPAVFVSSTYKDLFEHRTKVREMIAKCDFFFRGMEFFGADPDRLPPASVIVEAVRNADIYVGIFGVRYGSIDSATGLSMTELEFREAETGKKPMLLYVIHQDAPVAVSDIEPDPDGQRRLATLKAHIFSSYVAYRFRSVEDLALQAYADLQKLKWKGESSAHGEA
jgi:O-acetyl-ADP-ribose deacetylase (regulator of RNase III)